MTEPLLDLDTLAPTRQLVRIKTPEQPDGTDYELRTFADFGIADQQFLHSAGQQYQELWEQPKLSKSEQARLAFLLNKMAGMVLDAPSEVLGQLTDWQKGQVVMAFTVAPLINAEAQTEPDQTQEAAGSPSTSGS